VCEGGAEAGGRGDDAAFSDAWTEPVARAGRPAAAHALGIRNVFAVMGDPTSIGDYPEAMDNYDLVPSG